MNTLFHLSGLFSCSILMNTVNGCQQSFNIVKSGEKNRIVVNVGLMFIHGMS